jgi:hypothetical protein
MWNKAWCFIVAYTLCSTSWHDFGKKSMNDYYEGNQTPYSKQVDHWAEDFKMVTVAKGA